MTTTTTPSTYGSSTPLEDAAEPPAADRPSRRTARWWVAAAVGVLAIGGAVVAVAVADGSDNDGPVAPAVDQVADIDVAPAAPSGPVSADAAERRAVASAVSRCSGMGADAAERCLTARG